MYRPWLCNSPSINQTYRFPVFLFSAEENSFLKDGFFDWKNATAFFSRHESSKSHIEAFFILNKRAQVKGKIDTTQEYVAKCKYGDSVLQRVVALMAQKAEDLFHISH